MSKTITQIPIPSIILAGDWHGIVYAISTESALLQEHVQEVDEGVQEIIKEFNDKSHHTVSLREVKRETVLEDKRVQHFCTLVQFRVRDSY